MFELVVKDVFKITGRGYVIAGEITESGTILRNGDTLINKEDREQKIEVNSIEMLNYGSASRKLNHIGFLTDISDETAKALVGKRLCKQ
ncbi:hypothetical protein [Paenibacillus oleatilyticus]|uniref:hypothetical protein n=1 Tax=Paenibacillus oleatilyticus TaxID=2594886 RepID=UPI001C1FE37D|nr:hypothetical protein [Paenibacillus oleatilyticus]MBU7317168.1 hypothetical protein [Paenibacillus oleatilyticus]